MSSGVPTRKDLPPVEELERAMADYLRVSRGAHLFASEDEHLRAEQTAWDRLEAAREAVNQAERAGEGEGTPAE